MSTLGAPKSRLKSNKSSFTDPFPPQNAQSVHPSTESLTQISTRSSPIQRSRTMPGIFPTIRHIFFLTDLHRIGHRKISTSSEEM